MRGCENTINQAFWNDLVLILPAAVPVSNLDNLEQMTPPYPGSQVPYTLNSISQDAVCTVGTLEVLP